MVCVGLSGRTVSLLSILCTTMLPHLLMCLMKIEKAKHEHSRNFCVYKITVALFSLCVISFFTQKVFQPFNNLVHTVALQALKRKKRYDKQLQQIDGTLSTIEMQREALESANTNTNVLQTMSEAAKALKSAHQHM